ncbi:MAG TPA: signal peptidase II [Acidobacteriaceae bacterium]|nr:signal peptidase II [Acidobacteriaceae bacterium]
MTLAEKAGAPADCRLWLVLLSAAVVVLDRVTKWLVAAHIELGDAIPVIPNVFRISHVENQGAAFSLFNDSSSPARVRWLLLAFSLLAAFVVLFFLWKLGRTITGTSVALALIFGGALGNAYDRLRFGYVIDFLEVRIIHYHWPDFNIADSAIVIGGLLLLLAAFRETEQSGS